MWVVVLDRIKVLLLVRMLHMGAWELRLVSVTVVWAWMVGLDHHFSRLFTIAESRHHVHCLPFLLLISCMRAWYIHIVVTELFGPRFEVSAYNERSFRRRWFSSGLSYMRLMLSSNSDSVIGGRVFLGPSSLRVHCFVLRSWSAHIELIGLTRFPFLLDIVLWIYKGYYFNLQVRDLWELLLDLLCWFEWWTFAALGSYWSAPEAWASLV